MCKLLVIINVFLWILVIVNGQRHLKGPLHKKVVVCYVSTWAVYRPGQGSFSLDNLDPGLCTHLVYAFAGLDQTTWAIKPLDAWQDLEDNYGKGGYKKMVNLKARYPHLKVTLAIGGWNEGSPKYSDMAADPEKRKKFIQSCLQLLQRFGFDGLDLDWEYPSNRGGKPEDKQNFVTLVKELADAFKPLDLIVTSAIGAGASTMESAYDFSKLSKYLDYLHLMCYDYHGTWDGTFGPNAPVHGLHKKDQLSLNYTINYLLSNGVSPYKLILGLPLYGRTYELTDPDEKEVYFGSKAKSQGFPGKFTKENGFMGYNEICLELTNSSDWEENWDEQTLTPYLKNKDKLISYDNSRSIAIKVKLAIDKNLGGVMVWSIDTDDFKGDCKPEKDVYTDFESRLREMKDSPVLDDVIKDLELPGAGAKDIKFKTARNSYLVDNGKLTLRLPEREFSNYPMMRTISEAMVLAEQEKMIREEVQKRQKDNEIPVDEKQEKATAKRNSYCLYMLFLGLFLVRL